jgi:hypothetical protein
MTVVEPTYTEVPGHGDEQAWLVTWAALANGDSGAPVELVGHADRSVQVEGTFGAGGSCRIQGSNDSTNYRVLHDPAGTALNITAASCAQVLEQTRKMQPLVTAGDGTTSLTVSMLLRRTRR